MNISENLPQTSDTTESRLVDYERITLLFPRMRIGYLGMSVSVITVTYFLNKFASPLTAQIWATAMIIGYTPRIILTIYYTRQKKTITPDNIHSWENRLFYASIIPFATYASLAFLPYQYHVFEGLLIASLSITGLLSGGILLYSPSRRIIGLFLHLTLPALIIRMVYEQEVEFLILAIYLSMLYLLVIKLLNQQSELLIQNIRARIHNEQISQEDPLTGMGNRRRLEFADKLFKMSKRQQLPLQLVIFDIDHFKQFNDKHGHQAGDALLILIANIINDNIRQGDLTVRYGGEEFVAVLPATELKQAEQIVERILKRIETETTVTISAGIASLHNHKTLESLTHSADKALYQAKEAGRNCYIIAATDYARRFKNR